jgi:hypothetical protein
MWYNQMRNPGRTRGEVRPGDGRSCSFSAVWRSNAGFLLRLVAVLEGLSQEDPVTGVVF